MHPVLIHGAAKLSGHESLNQTMKPFDAFYIPGDEQVTITALEDCIILYCRGLMVDLADAGQRKEDFAPAVDMPGGLDILVNAAGIQRRYLSPDFPMEDWQQVLEVNLTAPFELCQLAAKEFLKKDVPYGKIINDTDMNAALTDPANPRRPLGHGEDMKGIAVSLDSAASDYVNGAAIPVDGGYLAKSENGRKTGRRGPANEDDCAVPELL